LDSNKSATIVEKTAPNNNDCKNQEKNLPRTTSATNLSRENLTPNESKSTTTPTTISPSTPIVPNSNKKRAINQITTTTTTTTTTATTSTSSYTSAAASASVKKSVQSTTKHDVFDDHECNKSLVSQIG
jgi:hypothetical protein